ncbi:MAG: hypothetical protein V4525_15715 [Pseudomonadota bacterium]
MKKILLTLFLSIAVTGQVNAGWYTVYNFKGSINSNPIQLSIQLLQGYSGDPKTVNVKGVYMYEKIHEPITLEGTLNEGNHILLKEADKKGPHAIFDFVLSEAPTITGSWLQLNTMNKLTLVLEKNGVLNDTNSATVINPVEVMQTPSLSDKYFIGVYSKKAGADRAKMDALKIIDKKTNTLFQEINFSPVETATGNVSTVIYENTQLAKNNIRVLNEIGKMGGYLNINLNSKTKRYVLNPKPVTEGAR